MQDRQKDFYTNNQKYLLVLTKADQKYFEEYLKFINFFAYLVYYFEQEKQKIKLLMHQN